MPVPEPTPSPAPAPEIGQPPLPPPPPLVLAMMVDVAELERVFFYAVNATRVAHGLPELIWLDSIGVAARGHSREMVVYDRWAHQGVDGSGVADRLRMQDVQGSVAGENLGAGSNLGGMTYAEIAWFIIYGRADMDSDPNSWMGSAGHRENLLNPHWTHTGLGVAVGYAHTRFDLYITQKFVQYP